MDIGMPCRMIAPMAIVVLVVCCPVCIVTMIAHD